MGDKIIFSSNVTNTDNKQLEKDEKGYYLITVGALNIFNSAGQYYTANEVRNMFEDNNSTLMRRIKSGFLKSEVGHPNLEKGMTKNEFFNRNLRIEETNVCAHIRDLMLVDTNTDSGLGTGDKTVLVKAWLKPSGPKGDFLQKALDNPDENVAFSVRSFTKNSILRGTTIRKIVQLITYDYVTEPGISLATKNKTLGLESENNIVFDMEDIADGVEVNECFECGLEDNNAKEVVKELITNVSKCEDGNCVLSRW